MHHGLARSSRLLVQGAITCISSPIGTLMDIATFACFKRCRSASARRIVDGRRQEFEANKLRKRLRRQVGEAIGDFSHDRGRRHA